VAAIGVLVAEKSVARSFCACSAKIEACVSACSLLNAALNTLLGVLVAILALSIGGGADPPLAGDPFFVGGVLAAFAVSVGALISLGIATAKITTCQP
jgi:hypothetical protein